MGLQFKIVSLIRRIGVRNTILLLATVFFAFSLLLSPLIWSRKLTINNRAAETKFSKQSAISQPEFVSGEVIVKFKGLAVNIEATSPKMVAGITTKKQPVSISDIDVSTLPEGLKKFRTSHPNFSITKVFKESNTLIKDLSTITRGKNPVNINTSFITKARLTNIYKLKLDSNVSVEQAIRELSKLPDVQYVEPNYIFKTNLIPNDIYYQDRYPANITNRDPNWNPSYDYQWNLKKINVEKGWDVGTGNDSIIVGIVDTGVDCTHEELANRCITGYNFINNTNQTADDFGHGTHIAGIIAAVSNNTKGVAGLNFTGKIMPVKVFDNQGSAGNDLIAAGIVYAAQHNARVINMSFGNTDAIPTISQVLKDALDVAFNLDVVLVAAAGNSNKDVSSGFWPANDPRVISVAATDENDQKAGYSNFGKIDISAPGGSSPYNLLSLNAHNPANPGVFLNLGGKPIGNGYLLLSGTSMSAPHVAGVAALLLGKDPSLTASEIKTVMQATTDDLGTAGFDDQFGAGRINAGNTMTMTKIPPVGEIYQPGRNSILGGTIAIIGTVGGRSFASYKIEVGLGAAPALWSTQGVTISNGGTASVANGPLGNIVTTNFSKGLWSIRLTVTGNNSTSTIRQITATIDPDIRAGWPIDLEEGAPTGGTDLSHFIAADLNGDGKKEIIATNQYGYVFVWNSNGQLLPGWKKYLGGNADGYIETPPAVGDFLRNGKKQIAVTAYRVDCYLTCITTVQLHVLDIAGNEINTAWPKPGEFKSLMFENVTGVLDLIAYNPADSKEYIFADDGSQMSRPIGNTQFMSIGDLNGDGKKEIITTADNTINAYDASNGTLLWSKTVSIPGITSSVVSWQKPTLADIDRDGKLEILVPAGTSSSGYNGQVWVFRHDGSNEPGWPQSSFTDQGNIAWSSITVSDIDNDGQVELIWGTDHGRVLIYKANGQILNILYGDSVYNDFYRGIAIGDVNGDNKPEIIASSTKNYYGTGSFFAWDYLGNSIAGWPKTELVFSTAQIVDLDNNGKVNLIAVGRENFNASNKLFIWSLNSTYNPSYIDWPVYGFNERRTGNWILPRVLPTPSPTKTPPTPTPSPTPISYTDLPLGFGKAVVIPAGSYIEVPVTQNNTSLNLQGSITIEAWVQFADKPKGFKQIVGKKDTFMYSGDDYSYVFGYFGTSLSIVPYLFSQQIDTSLNTQYYSFSIPYQFLSNRWYHVATTYQNGLTLIYVDGKLFSASSVSQQNKTITDFLKPLLIGYGLDDVQMKIDELRISNSKRDVQSLWQSNTYFNPLSVDSNTIALWHFDDNINDVTQYLNNGIPHGNIGFANSSNLPTPSPTPTCSQVICDINADGKENYLDGQFIMGCWGKTAPLNSCSKVDVDCDNTITTTDIQKFSYKCPQIFVTPTPTIRPTVPPLPTIPPENTIIIYAGGTPGNGVYPTMQLILNNRVVASWDNVNANGTARQTKQYTYNSPTKVRAQDQIRVSFINDYWSNTSDRNLFVDKIIVGGYIRETEVSSTYSTGTWSSANGCGPGFKKSEWLHCNGSFIFSNPIPTAAP